MAHGLQKNKEQLPSVINFAEDASDGLQGMTSQDMAIPYLVILQKMSPQLDTSNAKAGQIWNTVLEKAVDEITVVPCGYVRNFVEWVPREQGGGLVGVHAATNLPAHSRVDNKLITKTGNMLVETANHFVITVTDNGYDRGLITMTSSQLKPNRRWNSVMAGLKVPAADGQMVTPARYSHMYKMSTVLNKNEAGSWYGWDIELLNPVSDQGLYQEAKQFCTSVTNGEVQVGAPVPEIEADNTSDIM